MKGIPKSFFLIAGPCVIEQEKITLRIAQELKEITTDLNIPFVFKASYDKANRLSGESFRGPGLKKGIRVLEGVRREVGVPVLTDVHCRTEVPKVAKHVDVLQIPAFLSRQTDLVVAAAKTGKPLNIKKGQFLAPWDMRFIIEKAERAGCKDLFITERGMSFGYNNLVADMRSIAILKEFGYPVVFDATHSVQLPGGLGGKSGGQREMIPVLARAAVAAGCDGLFLEVHFEPDKALCDAPTTFPLAKLAVLLADLLGIYDVVS